MKHLNWKKFLASAFTLGFNTACQLVIFVIIARVLGPSEFGKLMIATSVTAIAAMLCGLGSHETPVRRIPRKPEQYPEIFGHCLSVHLATAIIIVPASAYLISRVAGLPLASSIALAIASTLIFRLVALAEQLLLGLVRFREANFINGAASVIRLGAAIAAAALGLDSAAVWCYWLLGANAAGLLICGWMLLRIGMPRFGLNNHEVRLGAWLTLTGIADTVRQNMDRLIMASFLPSSTIAQYAAASRVTQISEIAFQSLNRTVYPSLAKGEGPFISFAFRYLVIVLAISLATAATVGYLLAPLIPLLMGEAYQPVVEFLRVLCWLCVPVAAQTVPYDIMGIMQHHKLRSQAFFAASLVAAALTFVLTQWAGVQGAIAAAYASEILLLIFLWAAYIAKAVPVRTRNM